jgi:hypothetical protein
MTSEDLSWAAGFLEGEGSFYRSGGVLFVEASQVNREPIDKLQGLFGGCIYESDASNRPSVVKRGMKVQPQFRWRITGEKTIIFMLRIFRLMSAKRRDQIRVALGMDESTLQALVLVVEKQNAQ